MVSPIKDKSSDKPVDPLFVTQFQKNLFTSDKILLGEGNYGKIWAATKKELGESDKISDEWIKIDFGYLSKDKIESTSKYIQIKSLYEIGIDRSTYLRFKDNPSLLLAAHQCFTENELLMKASGLNLSEFSQFIELFSYEPLLILNLRNAPQENKGLVLNQVAARYIYHTMQNYDLMPDSLGIEEFSKIVSSKKESVIHWMAISHYWPIVAQSDFFAEPLRENNAKDFVSYLLKFPQGMSRCIEDLETITKALQTQNELPDYAHNKVQECRLSIIACMRSLLFTEFFEKHVKLLNDLSILSSSAFMELFPINSSTKILKIENDAEFIKSFSAQAFGKIYEDLRKRNIKLGMSQDSFVREMIARPRPMENLRNWIVIRNLPSMLNQYGIKTRFRLYNVTPTHLVDYFVYHSDPDLVGRILTEITNIKLDPSNIIKLEEFRKTLDKVASFKGLAQFYLEEIRKYPNQGNFYSFTEFLEIMELADMNPKKLKSMGTALNSFLRNVRDDYADFVEIKRIFPYLPLDFPRYLKYIDAFPDPVRFQRYLNYITGISHGRTVKGFREEVRENLDLIKQENGLKLSADQRKGVKALQFLLMDAKKVWTIQQYERFKCPVVELLFTEAHGAGKRFIRIDQKDPKHRKQVDVDKAKVWNKAHFVEIITMARNELEKGNTEKILYLYKETTHLLRTVVVSPATKRVYVLLKGKEVPEAPGRGTYKSVSQAVGIGPDNKPEIYANVTVPVKEGATRAEIEAWRKRVYQEFLLTGGVSDVSEHMSIKHGRLTATAFEKWLVVPDLKAEHVKSFSLKKRLHLLLGVLKDLNELHKRNLIHTDVKPDNMGGVIDDKTGNLRGTAFDFGLSNALSEVTSAGSSAYFSPSIAFESTYVGKGGRYTRLPQGDLWAFGLAMYEVLFTPTNPKEGERPRPSFYTDLEKLAGPPPKPSFHVLLTNLDQPTVNKSIDAINQTDQTKLPVGGDVISAETLDLLKSVLKSLLDVTIPNISKQNIDSIRQEALKLEAHLIDSLEAIVATLPGTVD